MNTKNISYTDSAISGDRFSAWTGAEVKTFIVNSRKTAVSMGGKSFKLNRRGNAGALFIGNFKVIGRV